MAARVVIVSPNLRGSGDERFPQKVATVYLDREEFNVVVPAKAKGEALELLTQFEVYQLSPDRTHLVTDGRSGSIIEKVQEELQKRRFAGILRSGGNPDRRYVAAQICLSGHVLDAEGTDVERGQHCPKCGEASIDACQHCNGIIRGGNIYRSTGDYKLSYFCHKCGHPYPWMEERLRTARDMLDQDDKLTEDDRKALWSDLKYVMSDPMADLVPEKKKLISFKLGKATDWVREALLDLVAKTAAEIVKG
jgi:hypothetical protein